MKMMITKSRTRTLRAQASSYSNSSNKIFSPNNSSNRINNQSPRTKTDLSDSNKMSSERSRQERQVTLNQIINFLLIQPSNHSCQGCLDFVVFYVCVEEYLLLPLGFHHRPQSFNRIQSATVRRKIHADEPVIEELLDFFGLMYRKVVHDNVDSANNLMFEC